MHSSIVEQKRSHIHLLYYQSFGGEDSKGAPVLACSEKLPAPNLTVAMVTSACEAPRVPRAGLFSSVTLKIQRCAKDSKALLAPSLTGQPQQCESPHPCFWLCWGLSPCQSGESHVHSIMQLFFAGDPSWEWEPGTEQAPQGSPALGLMSGMLF